MIRYVSQKQLPLEGFDTPPGMILDPANRWVKLRDCLPWDELSESYYKTLCSNPGRPAKDAGIVIGAVIIKHKLSISDEETVEQIRENPYLQYFIGLKGFQDKAPFASSLLVDDRIVSISQPYLRPIIRGKQGKAVEFGAKISVSLTDKGLAHVDKLHWDAQHEGHDLEAQVEAYKKRYGYYPEVVIADTLYGSRDNRSYLERKHIRFSGKPLGRPPKSTPENKDEINRLKAQRRQEYRERIPIEGKFGQGKYGYRLNNIRAKRADTSVAWINSIFLVMNLLILVRVFICLRNLAAKIASWVTKKSMPREIPFARDCQFISNQNFYLAARI